MIKELLIIHFLTMSNISYESKLNDIDDDISCEMRFPGPSSRMQSVVSFTTGSCDKGDYDLLKLCSRKHKNKNIE